MNHKVFHDAISVNEMIAARFMVMERNIQEMHSPEKIAAAVLKVLEQKTEPEHTSFLQMLVALFKS